MAPHPFYTPEYALAKGITQKLPDIDPADLLGAGGRKKKNRIYYYPSNDTANSDVKTLEKKRFGDNFHEKKLEFLQRIKKYELNFDKKVKGYQNDL